MILVLAETCKQRCKAPRTPRTPRTPARCRTPEAGPQLTRKLSAQQATMLGLYALSPATSTTPGAFGAFTRCVIELMATAGKA